MGDPKKIRKKYSTPNHPWQKSRIEEEIQLKRDYGLKNKKEIWIVASKLKKYQNQFKKLNGMPGNQASIEKEQLKNTLLSYGLLDSEGNLDSALNLGTRDLMERRLQTVLVKKGLARSVKQARQFITHRHVVINGKVVTSPSYLVKVTEEPSISFVVTSNLANSEHPERMAVVKKEKKKDKKEQTKEEVAAFDDVPEDEEEILKEDIKKKKTEDKE